MPPSDPRRVIGGAVWAKSTAVSNDSRRIYGVEADKTWIVYKDFEDLANNPCLVCFNTINASAIIGNSSGFRPYSATYNTAGIRRRHGGELNVKKVVQHCKKSRLQPLSSFQNARK